MAQFSTNIKVTNPENPKEVTHIAHLPILYSTLKQGHIGFDTDYCET